jgi:hypothetical protein
MKSNGLTTLLNGALAVCLVANVFFCIQFVNLSRELRGMNAKIMGINGWRNNVQVFVGECVKYSERDPTIIPILKTIGYENAPAGKAGAK